MTALLAVDLARRGYKVGVLDADITGPSIPRLFGVTSRPSSPAEGKGLIPPQTERGIKIMSLNLLLPDEQAPVIWRGPLISGAVQQFWTDVIWGELDYLLVDLPPGTSDVPLTVMQSLPLAGLVIVTSPQELVNMVVAKAINMAHQMEIPILGLVENMSYLECPQCGERIQVFGPSRTRAAAAGAGLRFLGALPLDKKLASLADEGRIEDYEQTTLQSLAEVIDG